jgi:glycosyltransferase involved in cell wall biosynthesis
METPPSFSETDGRLLGDVNSRPGAFVLFLIDELATAGGAELALVNLVRLLPSHGFRCAVATFRLKPGSDLPRLLSCPVHVFPLRRAYDINAAHQAWRLARLIRSEKVQIVHTFFETSDLWGGFIARLSGCPILISSRRDMGILRLRKHRLAYRMIGRILDRVQAVSDQVRQFCITTDRLPEDKVITIHNGVELERIDSGFLPVEHGQPGEINDTAPLIVCVANIRVVKGIDRFIRAAVLVHKEFPNARFAVIGGVLEESHFQELRHLADSLDLGGHFRFLGPQKDVFRFLHTASAFCLLSRSEGFSNSIIEAMACRLPCVVTDVGGNREAITDGDNGFIVADENEAAQRILQLLQDREFARRMGDLARCTVEERFTVEAMVRKTASLYQSLLHTRMNSPCRNWI